MNQMKIFKFGGASIKDVDGFINVCKILQTYKTEKICIVVSALAKTTNQLEEVVNLYFKNVDASISALKLVQQKHIEIANQLFQNTTNTIFKNIENIIETSINWLHNNQNQNYSYVYDQIICMGELLSSKILAAYLLEKNLNNTWIDARLFIKTDSTFQEGKVNFELTETLVTSNLCTQFHTHNFIITQGFIASNEQQDTVTLAREGSDYTAAIIAYCLNAQAVYVWKDVAGVLNADPKYFSDATLISELSYQDAIEMTYFGASVIHPKTVQPLQNKNIPLYIKSFIHPLKSGTTISQSAKRLSVPSYIFKPYQILISLHSLNFSFIAEDNLSHIFNLFSKHAVKINMMQLSAISFTVCCDAVLVNKCNLLDTLSKSYKVTYNMDVELLTIQHFNLDVLTRLTDNKTVLLDQRSRATAQLVLKSNLS